MLAFKTTKEINISKRIYGPVTFPYCIGPNTVASIGGWPLRGVGSYTVTSGFQTLEVTKPGGIEDETCIGVLNTVPNRADGTYQPDAQEFKPEFSEEVEPEPTGIFNSVKA